MFQVFEHFRKWSKYKSLVSIGISIMTSLEIVHDLAAYQADIHIQCSQLIRNIVFENVLLRLLAELNKNSFMFKRSINSLSIMHKIKRSSITQSSVKCHQTSPGRIFIFTKWLL